jgi:hypothetical protein
MRRACHVFDFRGVADSGGGVLPGATVVVASNATGTKTETVTNASGAYTVPALSAGVYTVTVSLQGFKTSVINDVRVVTRSKRNGTGACRLTATSGSAATSTPCSTA